MDAECIDRDTLISADENREMFNRLAHTYDLANRTISMGQDRRWRRKAIEILKPHRGGRYLDVGTGTGELAFELLSKSSGAQVTGIDPSEQMLDVARNKAAERGVGDRVEFSAADALELPVDDNYFNGVVSGFCFRNLEHRQQALSEMFRVLKPGGTLVILEAVCPENPVVRRFCCCYKKLVPMIGGLLGNASAYRYLVSSIETFPSSETVDDMLTASGFSGVCHTSLALGSVCIFSGRKP